MFVDGAGAGILGGHWGAFRGPSVDLGIWRPRYAVFVEGARRESRGTIGGPGDLAAKVYMVIRPGGLFLKSNNPNLSGGAQFCCSGLV